MTQGQQDDSGRSASLYGEVDEQKAGKIDTRLSVPDPVLDIYGEDDPRAVSRGNRGF